MLKIVKGYGYGGYGYVPAYSVREQIVGVSSDEELTNMIMYQNAYNASSRYINVISEMLDHLLSTLGR